MYSPTQNGIEKVVRSVRYVEAVPPSNLAQQVHCFWELKTDTMLPTDFQYHVLPDACVDIIFNMSDRHTATIMTPHVTSDTLNLGTSFHYIGIRLLPGVWCDNVEKIVGGFVDTSHLGALVVSEIGNQLYEQTFSAQQTVLTKVVARLTAENLIAANRLIATILAEVDGIHTVADMASVAKMSPRQLQRSLKQMTGFSPHDFLKVLRLQQSFGQHYLAQYADQSHFIHSFRKITGYTPKKYAERFDS